MPSGAAPTASGADTAGTTQMEGVEQSGESTLRDVAVQMVALMARTPKEVAAEWAGLVATLFSTPGQGAVLSAANPGGVQGPKGAELGAMPEWAAGAEDKRDALHWDTSQTVADAVLGGKAVRAVVDTGSYKTILDIGMARMLGLPIREARGGDCGTYTVPGTDRSICYSGVVDGLIQLQLTPDVKFLIRNLKLIQHPYPLLLVGSDILSGGRPAGQWNYHGVLVDTSDHGETSGRILFKRGQE